MIEPIAATTADVEDAYRRARVWATGTALGATTGFEAWLAAEKAAAWREGHEAGQDYRADGWNSDCHDPQCDNPYKEDA